MATLTGTFTLCTSQKLKFASLFATLLRINPLCILEQYETPSGNVNFVLELFWHQMLHALIYLQIKSQRFAHSTEKPEAACPTRKVTRLGLQGTLRSFATDLLLSLGQAISFLCASKFSSHSLFAIQAASS